jgi:hypothetical protein
MTRHPLGHQVVGVSSCNPVTADHSILMLAARITFPHFSVSSAMSLPKSAGEPESTEPPSSVMRALIVGSTRARLISLFSFSMMSAGVFFGAVMPIQKLDRLHRDGECLGGGIPRRICHARSNRGNAETEGVAGVDDPVALGEYDRIGTVDDIARGRRESPPRRSDPSLQ